MIILAFLFWVIGIGEGRVIVRRANKLVILIQIRSKIWTWACNFAEEMENTHTYSCAGENLDLSKEGDTHNYNIFNFKRKREN